MKTISSMSIGFTWWAPSQHFSRSPSYMKARESGDVRLILDTQVERAAEQKCNRRLCTLPTVVWTQEYTGIYLRRTKKALNNDAQNNTRAILGGAFTKNDSNVYETAILSLEWNPHTIIMGENALAGLEIHNTSEQIQIQRQGRKRAQVCEQWWGCAFGQLEWRHGQTKM